MTTRHVDVLVVGGGPVGVLTAALLAQAGVDVLVVERRAEPSRSSRAIGLHPPGLEALARVGVADAVLADAVRVGRGVATSRGRTLGALSFGGVSPRFPFVATTPLSWTEQVLRSRLEALAPGALLRGRSADSLDTTDRDRVRLTTSRSVAADPDRAASDPAGSDPDRSTVEARFVVAADGPRSPVRTMLGAPRDVRSYTDAYAMGDFADPDPRRARPDAATGPGSPDAVIDVGPHGVVESFPLPDGTRRYVVWTDAPFDDRDPGAPATLAAIVRQRTGTAPDPATCTMVSGFRPHRGIVRRMVHGRVVLVGDAAHEISPIGGQGMNLGWLDAVALAPMLTDAIRTGGTIPVDALLAFERRQLRRARVAARQAEWNMRLGRPAAGSAILAREAGLRAALGLPTARLLADVYSMRHV
ncbi:FAD-dependent oxidoreductase [Curtobacterium sp. RRHDQ10]|uniref:FAD-dependent oxidoreductase n=1 Tax=Curtobacterium phyllosphaerae TaxID=3413379 RepID=UPI003BF3FE66